MFRIEIIGNLGSDAEVREYNGEKFVSFRVADTQRFTNTDGSTTEQTTWISCTMQGEQRQLLPYLKKGQRVFLRGRGYLKLYDSKVAHAKVAGCDMRVSELELVGASKEDRENAENWLKANEYIASLGYQDWAEIPQKTSAPPTPSK